MSPRPHTGHFFASALRMSVDVGGSELTGAGVLDGTAIDDILSRRLS